MQSLTNSTSIRNGNNGVCFQCHSGSGRWRLKMPSCTVSSVKHHLSSKNFKARGEGSTIEISNWTDCLTAGGSQKTMENCSMSILRSMSAAQIGVNRLLKRKKKRTWNFEGKGGVDEPRTLVRKTGTKVIKIHYTGFLKN